MAIKAIKTCFACLKEFNTYPNYVTEENSNQSYELCGSCYYPVYKDEILNERIMFAKESLYKEGNA